MARRKSDQDPRPHVDAAEPKPIGMVAALSGLAARGLRLVRGDSWENALTGLGIYGRDKVQSHAPGALYTLADSTLESLYHGDAIAARIVEKVVDDGMRQGCTIVPPEGADASAVEKEWERVAAWPSLKMAAIWGRLYGSGGVLLGIDDGQADQTQPLEVDRVRGVRYLTVLDGSEYQTATRYADPLDPRYDTPETIRLLGFSGIVTVHESRILRFPGVPTSRKLVKANGDRDYSVLQRVVDALQRFDSDWRSTSAMMVDGSQGVLKIKGFANVIAGGSKGVFEERMSIVNLCRSVARIMPIDADDEDFAYVDRSWAGVADLLDKTTLYLAACSDGMPVTVLFGRSPAGMDATGEGDRIGWYDRVQSWRDSDLMPRATRLMQIVCRAVGIDPAGWSIELPALLQESDADFANRRKTIGETDNAYVSSGVLLPEEVAIARFGSGAWSDAAPQIDTTARERLLAMDTDRALNGPPESDEPDEPDEPEPPA